MKEDGSVGATKTKKTTIKQNVSKSVWIFPVIIFRLLVGTWSSEFRYDGTTQIDQHLTYVIVDLPHQV